MPIAVGDRLGSFVIRAPLGKGGMGEVYLAFDPRLGREIALKVLLPGAIGNPERRARFVQEAKLASSLNHRNIVTIYDIDTAGVGGEAVDFVAMEYVRGKTLDKLIGRKGLRLSEALAYARDIADGLAAAHRAGIIHRDLKPANIIVSDQGDVKILDFGLAKLVETDAADAWAPTESVHLETASGVIAGTAAYMSPEQAEGQRVDARSDIFSFGAVLYEMFSGRRAFNGASKLSTLASVLHTDPGSLTGTHEKLPRELDRIVQRCLRKDPRRRWQNVADLKIALEDVSEQPQDGPVAAAGRPPSNWRRWVPAFGGVLALLMLAAGVYLGANSLRHPHPTFERLTFRRGDISGARFAPDGTVLYSAHWAAEPATIFSTRPGRNESRPLGLPSARILSISSTGDLAILLGSATAGTPGTLARVPLSGGAPREILENVVEADWSPDGSTLAVSRIVGGRNRIEYPIGNIRTESQGRPAYNLRISPKGDLLAFFQYDNAVGDFAVAVLDRRGVKRVLSRGWAGIGGLAWAPAGNEIWYVGTATGGEPVLRAVKLNGKERVVLSTPAWFDLKDISREGRVLATVTDSRLGISALMRGAEQERDLSWFEASRIYDMSPDGREIVFVEMTYGSPRNKAIYLRPSDGSPAVRIGNGNQPALSPDGKWVACIASDGPNTALSLLPTGPGETRTIGPSAMHYDRVEWFPDSRRILFYGNYPDRPPRTYAQDIDGGQPVPITPEGMFASRVSPNQKFATVLAGGKLSLLPLAGGEPKKIANLEPGESVIQWSPDSRFLFLRQRDRAASLRIDRLDVTTGRLELWKRLNPPDAVGVQMGPLVVTPDGKSYAYSFQRDISTLYLAENLK